MHIEAQLPKILEERKRLAGETEKVWMRLYRQIYARRKADQQKQQPEAAGIMRVMPEKTGNWKRFLSGLTDG